MEVSSQRITDAAVAAAARIQSMSTEKVKSETEPAKPKAEEVRQQEEINPDAVDVRLITKTLNEFFATINADLHFEIHEDTQRMIVQLVNAAEKKVLKEFPRREFLDMVARIRDYVGALLDKRV